MTRQEADEMVRKAASSLGEHFDSVRIIATWDHEGFTSHCSSGSGNFYAQKGSVSEWLVTVDQSTRNWQVKQDQEEEL